MYTDEHIPQHIHVTLYDHDDITFVSSTELKDQLKPNMKSLKKTGDDAYENSPELKKTKKKRKKKKHSKTKDKPCEVEVNSVIMGTSDHHQKIDSVHGELQQKSFSNAETWQSFKKKKKKKSRKGESGEYQTTDATEFYTPTEEHIHKKHKTRKSKSSDSSLFLEKTSTKNNSSRLEDVQNESSSVLKKQKDKQRDGPSETVPEALKEHRKEKKAKKHKLQKGDNSNIYITQLQQAECTMQEPANDICVTPKKKHKKKDKISSKEKIDCEAPISEPNSEHSACIGSCESKKNKHKKKKPIKNETSEHVQVHDHSEKAGEKEAIDINTDKHDTTNKTPTEKPSKSTMFNQWSTVGLLGGSDRQHKFLNLMGAFKKSKDATKVAGSSSGNHVRMLAMDKRTEDSWANTMSRQFEDTMSMQQSIRKGFGLGYQEPESKGKKFHIDTCKVSSVKFS